MKEPEQKEKNKPGTMFKLNYTSQLQVNFTVKLRRKLCVVWGRMDHVSLCSAPSWLIIYRRPAIGASPSPSWLLWSYSLAALHASLSDGRSEDHSMGETTRTSPVEISNWKLEIEISGGFPVSNTTVSDIKFFRTDLGLLVPVVPIVFV